MKISYNWLQSYFSKKLPEPNKLAELLTMHSFEVEDFKEIRSTKHEIRNKSEKINSKKETKDWIFDIDVLPNRTHDCLSHIGVAKECGVLLGYKMKNTSPNPSLLRKGEEGLPLTKGEVGGGELKIQVKDPELCRRYMGRVIENIEVKESPKWLKERLEAIGQKSINNIVDATNYVMFETGQPLHAFDSNKLESRKLKVESKNEKQIIIRKAKRGVAKGEPRQGREKITTLDGQEVELDENILVIADKKEALVIAGIKGGKKAEVDKNTTSIILESANFEPVNIRETSRKIGIRTESSLRFEQGLSPELAEMAMDRMTELILEIAQAKDTKVGKKVDVYPKKQKRTILEVRPEDISKLLGIDVKEKDMVDILTQLGFEVKKGKNKMLVVTVPFERLDVERKEDLIEEVARIYGYEKIPSTIPSSTIIPPARNDTFFYAELVRNILIGIGFSEVYNYSFDSDASVGVNEKDAVELANPIAKDKKFLRKSLLEGLNKNIKENLKYFSDVRVFEIGKIFNKNGETFSLAVATGSKKPSSNKDNFYEMKGVVEILLNKMGVTDVYFDSHGEKVADIKVGDASIGTIDHNALEINFEAFVHVAQEENEYRAISRYPAMKRDVAIFVPLNTKMIEVLDVIENTAKDLLIDTDLFDIYEDIENDRKSLAFHLIFQSNKKTLSDKEVNVLMNKIMTALDANVDWEVRK